MGPSWSAQIAAGCQVTEKMSGEPGTAGPLLVSMRARVRYGAFMLSEQEDSCVSPNLSLLLPECLSHSAAPTLFSPRHDRAAWFAMQHD